MLNLELWKLYNHRDPLHGTLHEYWQNAGYIRVHLLRDCEPQYHVLSASGLTSILHGLSPNSNAMLVPNQASTIGDPNQVSSPDDWNEITLTHHMMPVSLLHLPNPYTQPSNSCTNTTVEYDDVIVSCGDGDRRLADIASEFIVNVHGMDNHRARWQDTHVKFHNTGVISYNHYLFVEEAPIMIPMRPAHIDSVQNAIYQQVQRSIIERIRASQVTGSGIIEQSCDRGREITPPDYAAYMQQPQPTGFSGEVEYMDEVSSSPPNRDEFMPGSSAIGRSRRYTIPPRIGHTVPSPSRGFIWRQFSEPLVISNSKRQSLCDRCNLYNRDVHTRQYLHCSEFPNAPENSATMQSCPKFEERPKKTAADKVIDNIAPQIRNTSFAFKHYTWQAERFNIITDWDNEWFTIIWMKGKQQLRTTEGFATVSELLVRLRQIIDEVEREHNG